MQAGARGRRPLSPSLNLRPCPSGAVRPTCHSAAAQGIDAAPLHREFHALRRNLRLVVGALAVALMGANCSEEVKECESGDSSCSTEDAGGYTGATSIESTGHACDEADAWFDVYTVGWTDSATLYIAQTGVAPEVAWFEAGHVFPVSAPYSAAVAASTGQDTRGYYDPAGFWDNPYMELARVSGEGEVALGSTTLFQCDANRESTLTWAIEVMDSTGAFADCFAWGHDVSASSLEAWGYDFSGCRS